MLLPRCWTVPLTGATAGVPVAAIMSTPRWDRPPERGYPHESMKDDGRTGHTNPPDDGGGGGGGGGGGAVGAGAAGGVGAAGGAVVDGAGAGGVVPGSPTGVA